MTVNKLFQPDNIETKRKSEKGGIILSSKVAVVIPIYKEKLDEFEKISLAQVRKILGKYPIVFVAPEGKIFPYLEQNDLIAQFPQKFFQNMFTYSKLMMSPKFYEPFLDFDHILIYQLDAFVFYDALEEFCSLGYDYIGAPVAYHSWYGYKQKKFPRVGNGGFSLRKVKACRELLTEFIKRADWNYCLENFYEDAFFAMCGADDETNFNTAPVEVAVCFAVDYFPDRFLRRVGNKIPFGCHGWSKYSADAYVKLFAQAGYDLRPFRNKMGNEDYEIRLEVTLEVLALSRLIRGFKRGQSALQYLPTKKFTAIRVIRNLDAMKILAQLLTENNFITDKIFFYDTAEFMNLVNDATVGDLIISAEYDESLIKYIKDRGISVVSFRQEYLKHCEKIFHSLGK